MTNAGNPDHRDETEHDLSAIDQNALEEQSNRGCAIPVLLGIGFAIIILSLVGIQAISVFVALIAPPMPPVPHDVILLNTTTNEFGWTIWSYEVDTARICEIITFYQTEGDCEPVLSCDAFPDWHIGQPITTCQADVVATNFTMRWYATMNTSPQSALTTEIKVSRFIAWLGDVLPEPTPIERIPLR